MTTSFDLRLRKFQLQPQRIGNAIGHVDEAYQNIEFEDFGILKMFFQRSDVGIADLPWRAGEFFGVSEGSLFLLCE